MLALRSVSIGELPERVADGEDRTMNMPESVRIVYLPANAAYMVMWHDQRLAGPMPLADAREYCRRTWA